MATATISKDIGTRARHRIALRLLPYLFVLYVIAFLDRTNISTAALQMPQDLGFDAEVIGFGSGIFFWGYFLLEIPGALIVERWSARRWIARIMVSWGIISVGMAFIRTPGQFYVMRFLLGAAEAGFFPGIIVYLTHWFINEDRAKAVANFMAAIPISFVLGSPISGWLLGVHWFGLSGWRWLFIVEGAPAILFGVITWFYLTDWPHQAKWLPPAERDWIINQLETEKAAKKAIRSYTILQAFCDPKVLLLTAVYFVNGTVSYCFSFFLPTMLKRLPDLPTLGITGLKWLPDSLDFRITLLVALMNVVAFIAMQANGWHSDRTTERRWHTAMPLALAGVSLLLLVSLHPGTWVTILLFTLVISSMMAFVPTFWTMPAAFLSESAAAACVGLINCVAMLGGFFGPYLTGYLVNKTGSFNPAFVWLLVSLFVGAGLTLAVRVHRLR